MHDFDVVEEDFLTDEDLDCDVVVLMYDASDKTSFETVAILYRNHFLNPSPASAPFMPPVLICGAKSDRVEVRQVSNSLFTAMHSALIAFINSPCNS